MIKWHFIMFTIECTLQIKVEFLFIFDSVDVKDLDFALKTKLHLAKLEHN